MKLIFVHGRDQQGLNPKILKLQWTKALNKGFQNAKLKQPDNIDIIFPFYGDELARLVKDMDTPLIEDVIARGSNQDTQEASFRGEIIAEIAKNVGLTDDDFLKFYPNKELEKGPLNWEWVQAILKALDSKCPNLGEKSIDFFTRDVYLYLTNRNIQQAINKIVANSIKIGENSVVVGHSLGSIVAYNVLREINIGSPFVNKYITVGSPLGLRSIKDKLASPLRMPKCVSAWFNAYDDKDVVALKPLDSTTFPITPPIQNKSNVNNHTENHHGIVGYLDDAEIARWIWDALME